MVETSTPPYKDGNIDRSKSQRTYFSFHPLTTQEEDGEFIIGRKETGTFVTLPQVGVRALEFLKCNYSMEKTQRLLNEEFNADVDLEDFINTLLQLGFIKAVNGHILPTETHHRSNLAWLKPRTVQWLFKWPISILYATLVLASIISIIRHPHLIPTMEDFLWSPSTTLALVGNSLWLVVNLSFHELSHLIAARSLGIVAWVNLSTRLHYLVVHTNISGLWAVPRNKRYRVYLAGLLWDIIPISLSILFIRLLPLHETAQRALSAIILMNSLAIVWQFFFYMRTDIFFVFQDLSHCYNLYQDSISYLKAIPHSLISMLSNHRRGYRKSILDHIPPRERGKVRLYAWIMLVGSSLGLLTFIFVGIPFLVDVLMDAVDRVLQGAQAQTLEEWFDAILTISILGVTQGIFVITLLKKHWMSIRSKMKHLFRRSQTETELAQQVTNNLASEGAPETKLNSLLENPLEDTDFQLQPMELRTGSQPCTPSGMILDANKPQSAAYSLHRKPYTDEILHHLPGTLDRPEKLLPQLTNLVTADGILLVKNARIWAKFARPGQHIIYTVLGHLCKTICASSERQSISNLCIPLKGINLIIHEYPLTKDMRLIITYPRSTPQEHIRMELQGLLHWLKEKDWVKPTSQLDASPPQHDPVSVEAVPKKKTQIGEGTSARLG